MVLTVGKPDKRMIIFTIKITTHIDLAYLAVLLSGPALHLVKTKV
jgi:hypothetical protein